MTDGVVNTVIWLSGVQFASSKSKKVYQCLPEAKNLERLIPFLSVFTHSPEDNTSKVNNVQITFNRSNDVFNNLFDSIKINNSKSLNWTVELSIGDFENRWSCQIV